ncbi:MAG: chemotaxis protein CheW, partial [Clostridiaceae bacterium]|nr:chemotaxis protein CheW [Clostridiaceae bacterium]
MSQKHVIFKIGDEYFAVKISQVLEIIYSQEIFKVPDVPSYVEGLINLRGSIYTL